MIINDYIHNLNIHLEDVFNDIKKKIMIYVSTLIILFINLYLFLYLNIM